MFSRNWASFCHLGKDLLTVVGQSELKEQSTALSMRKGISMSLPPKGACAAQRQPCDVRAAQGQPLCNSYIICLMR